jgi:hypothetical protein
MTPAARRVAISIYERLNALMEFPEQELRVAGFREKALS